MENKIDEILDDLAQCTGQGKWDKHYLDVVEEIRKDLIDLCKIDQAYVCELAHNYTVEECNRKDIQINRDYLRGEDETYTTEAQDIFNKHYKLITEILGV